MFDIGFWELVVIFVMALLILGPKRMPAAVRSVSRTIKTVRQFAGNLKTEIEQELRIQELHENLKKAESQDMKDLSPELQKSVDELKAAAKSVKSKAADKRAADNHAADDQ